MKTHYRVGAWQRLCDFLTAPFHSPNTRLIKRLRRAGVEIGEGCVFRDPRSTTIDLTRPSLIRFGNHVDVNVRFTIMTHDFASGVFLHHKKQLINSSGEVHLGNNIYCGRDVTILKGVHIGDNCVIGLGSVVMHDIPSNSVVAGCPARVISSLEDYYQKRCQKAPEEAFEYARSIVSQFGRRPIVEDFWEEFPLFVSGNEVDQYPMLPIRRQLQEAYPDYVAHHKAPYKGFEDFLAHALEDPSKANKKANVDAL